MQKNSKEQSNKATKENKSPSADLIWFSDMIDGKLDALAKEPFPLKFHVYMYPDGVREILEEDPKDRTVKRVLDQKVYSTLITWSTKTNKAKGEFDLSDKMGYRVVDFWKNTKAPLSEMPKSFAQKSEPGLAFSRMPFDIPEKEWDTIEASIANGFPGEHTWAEIFTRASNWRAFACFIGSIFEPRSDRQQYLYIHGAGQNSKGALARLLKRILGNGGYHADDPNSSKSQFWTYSFLGKRVVAFPDANTPAFAKSGLFKTLTGGDSIRVEQKRGPTFTAELEAKFIFMSNEELQLTSSKADFRRAVFVHMEPVAKDIIPTAEYDAMLWREAPEFLSFCLWMYRKYCPRHQAIPVDIEELEALAEQTEAPYQSTFNRYFMLTGEENHMVDVCEVYEVLMAEGIRAGREQGHFRRWMESQPGVRRMRKNFQGSRRNVYTGIRKKTFGY